MAQPTTTPTPARTPARTPALPRTPNFTTKARGEPSFDFGFNLPRRQTASDRQQFAMARGRGGPLHGQSGS